MVNALRVVLLLLLSLTPALAQAQQDPTEQCMDGLVSDPSFEPISQKIALGDNPKVTFAMLADESYPSDMERRSIASWASAIDHCVELGATYRKSAYPPQLLALFAEAYAVFLGGVVDLYNRKIAYGEFNRQRQANFDQVAARATDIMQRIQAQQLAEEQAREQVRQQNQRDQRARQEMRQAEEDAARREAALYLLNRMRTNQLPVAPYEMPTSRSRTTNCQWIGNVFSCIGQ